MRCYATYGCLRSCLDLLCTWGQLRGRGANVGLGVKMGSQAARVRPHAHHLAEAIRLGMVSTQRNMFGNGAVIMRVGIAASGKHSTPVGASLGD